MAEASAPTGDAGDPHQVDVATTGEAWEPVRVVHPDPPPAVPGPVSRAEHACGTGGPAGLPLEHPTADEGCRSASQGLTLTLDAENQSKFRFAVRQTLLIK